MVERRKGTHPMTSLFCCLKIYIFVYRFLDVNTCIIIIIIFFLAFSHGNDYAIFIMPVWCGDRPDVFIYNCIIKCRSLSQSLATVLMWWILRLSHFVTVKIPSWRLPFTVGSLNMLRTPENWSYPAGIFGTLNSNSKLDGTFSHALVFNISLFFGFLHIWPLKIRHGLYVFCLR